MLKRFILWYRLNKFYKIFGEYLDCASYRISFKDMFNDDVVFGCGFDIAEALDGLSDCKNDPMVRWLNKLNVVINH